MFTINNAKPQKQKQIGESSLGWLLILMGRMVVATVTATATKHLKIKMRTHTLTHTQNTIADACPLFEILSYAVVYVTCDKQQ